MLLLMMMMMMMMTLILTVMVTVVVVAGVQVFLHFTLDVDISHHQSTLLWEGIQFLQF